MSKRNIRRDKYTANYSKQQFVAYLNSNKEIKNRSGEVYHIADDEVFVQCYDPEDPYRKNLPKYWFLSNKEELFSSYGTAVTWLNKYDDSTYHAFKFDLYTEDGEKISNRKMKLHHLMAMVFGASTYGKVECIIKDKGIDCFKCGEMECHHKDLNPKNNSPENLRLLPTPVHPLLHSVPKQGASEEEEIKFMRKLADVVGEQEPEKITLLTTGKTVDRNTLGFIEDTKYRDIESVDYSNVNFDVEEYVIEDLFKECMPLFIKDIRIMAKITNALRQHPSFIPTEKDKKWFIYYCEEEWFKVFELIMEDESFYVAETQVIPKDDDDVWMMYYINHSKNIENFVFEHLDICFEVSLED